MVFAFEVLDIEADVFSIPDDCYSKLGAILAATGESIKPSMEPKQILEAIGNVLAESFEFGHTHMLCVALDKGILDCKHWSYLYISLAEMLDLPLHFITAPSHLAIRWDDGTEYFNWETTNNKLTNDSFYMNALNIAEVSVANGVFLANLTKENGLSEAYFNRGISRGFSGDFNGAMSDFYKALELNPSHIEAHNSLGNCYVNLNQFELALKNFNSAIALNPNYVIGFANRAGVYILKSEDYKALADLNRALELNPNFSQGYYNRAKLKLLMGNFEAAELDASEAIRLEPKEPSNYELRADISAEMAHQKTC